MPTAVELPANAQGNLVNKLASARTIQVHVSEDIKLESLQQVVAHITHLAGCTGCGLLGVDLHITGDPVELSQVGQIQGVRSINRAA